MFFVASLVVIGLVLTTSACLEIFKDQLLVIMSHDVYKIISKILYRLSLTSVLVMIIGFVLVALCAIDVWYTQ